MGKNKYTHTIGYSRDRKNIELVKLLNTDEKPTTVVKSENLNPEHVAWVLIHWLKGNGLKEINTKFGTLELKEEK